MKKITLILILLLSCSLVFAQSVTESKVSAVMRSSDAVLAKEFMRQTGFRILFDGPEFDLYEVTDFSPLACKDGLLDLSDLIPNKINAGILPYVSDGDGIYAYPFAVKACGIAINRAVLTEAGVDPEAINSWEDFERACQQLKFKGFTPIVMDGDGAAWFMKMALSGFFGGKEAELSNGKIDARILGRIPAMLDRWVKKGYVAESGKAGFIFAADGADTIPFPSVDGKPAYVVEYSAIAVSKGAGADALAAELLKFVSVSLRPVQGELNYAEKYFGIGAAEALAAGAKAILAGEAGAAGATTAAVVEAF
jgi:hypothetical protein